jgi:hypothetical protein
MKKLLNQLTALTGVSTLASLSVSCGQSKVAQCNEMVKASNVAAKVVQEFSSASKMKDSTEIAKFYTTTANKLSTHNKTMQALAIKDETLQGFQTRYVTMYDSTVQGGLAVAAALQEKNETTFQKALQQMQSSISKGTALADEVNGYCSGK